MKRKRNVGGLTAGSFLAAIGFAVAVGLGWPGSALAQSRRSGPPARTTDRTPVQQRDIASQKGAVHARRETVRTNRPPTRTPADAPAPVRALSQRNQPNPAGAGQRPATQGLPAGTVRTLPNAGQRQNTRPQPTDPNRTLGNPGQRPNTRPQPTDPNRNLRNTSGRNDYRDEVSRPSAASTRPSAANVLGALAQRIFTRTPQGRRYDNGMQLRRGQQVNQDWQRRYFPRGNYHYPYYSPSYGSASVAISPFGFYFGICAPFISRSHAYQASQVVMYVDVPRYDGADSRGYAPLGPDENYLNQDYLWQREPGIGAAVDQLREAFGHGNIDSLVALTDPNRQIAVFLEGKYAYSLNPNDFVDLTRDGLQAIQTVSFDLTRIHQAASGVYVVSGAHAYKDRNGGNRQVYVSYVLEDIAGVWTLTQVGTSPDHIQEWQ